MSPVPRAKRSSRRGAASGQQVRIIGGRWRRMLLPVAHGPGLRPTPDRVRETLFNWLGQDLTGWRCMDAFAGSGALGFEAASRGALAVLMVERDMALAARLRQTRQRLGASTVQVLCGDGIAKLQTGLPASLDLILLDPPFEETGLIAPALQAAARAVRPDGFVYLETGQRPSDAALAELGLRRHRYLHAGAVHAHLLVPDS